MARILLIEPDTLLSTNYVRTLAGVGHVVHVARTAEKGIARANDSRPDLVLLELHLAGRSGMEFLYEFRSYEDWQDIPVIVLSVAPIGEFKASWEILTSQLGVHAYLYKPRTSLVALRDAVDSLVGAPR